MSQDQDHGEKHDLLTREEVSDWLKIHPDTLDRWRKSKGFPQVKINRAVRFDRAEILRWLENRRGMATLKETPVERKGGVDAIFLRKDLPGEYFRDGGMLLVSSTLPTDKILEIIAANIGSQDE